MSNIIKWQAVDLREVRVSMNRIVMALSIGAVLQVSAAAGQPVPPGAGPQAPQAGGGQGGQGGQAAGGNQPPPVQVISRRPPAAVLGTIRGGAADGTIWFGWPVSMPSTAIAGATLSDVLAIADGLGVPGVEASSTQRTAFEVLEVVRRSPAGGRAQRGGQSLARASPADLRLPHRRSRRRCGRSATDVRAGQSGRCAVDRDACRDAGHRLAG